MISILIVDTEKITRDILFRLVALSFPNATLHITARFESAMELCRIFKVNIVITTASVPPTQSDAMLEALRSIEYNPIKIIIMTSESNKEELDKISSVPNTCLICKPIALEELVNLIAGKIEEIEMSRAMKT